MRDKIISNLKIKVEKLINSENEIIESELWLDLNRNLCGTSKYLKGIEDTFKLKDKNNKIRKDIKEFIIKNSITEKEFYDTKISDIGCTYEKWVINN